MKKSILISILIIAQYSLVIVNCSAQWQHTNNSIDGKYIASMASRGNKVFAGTSDGLYMSIDKGAQWKAINHGLPKKEIWALAAADTNMIVGTWGGGLFLSNSTDTVWTYSGVNNASIDDILVNDTNIFVGCYGEGIFLSTDGGKNWKKTINGLSDNYVHTIVRSKTNLVAGTANGIFLSTNNGQNWKSIDSGIINSTDIRGMIIKDTSIFAGTSGAGIYKSEDSGVSWDSISTGPSYSVVWCFAISGANIFAGTYGGGVFLSSDNGLHWREINQGFTNSDYVLSVMSICISEGYVYVGTKTGGVWKRALSEILGIDELGPSTSLRMTELEVYPNPANQLIIINYQLTIKSNTTLKIYDLMGIEVDESGPSTSLRMTELGIKGEHSIQYDTGKLRNGVYFVRLQSDNLVRVAKFIKQ